MYSLIMIERIWKQTSLQTMLLTIVIYLSKQEKITSAGKNIKEWNWYFYKIVNFYTIVFTVNLLLRQISHPYHHLLQEEIDGIIQLQCWKETHVKRMPPWVPPTISTPSANHSHLQWRRGHQDLTQLMLHLSWQINVPSLKICWKNIIRGCNKKIRNITMTEVQ